MANRIAPIPSYAVQGTVASGCLVAVADDLRQLYTDFGLRPYRVYLVWVGWTADEDGDGLVQGEELRLDPAQEGVGRAVLLREVEILPTPLVESMAGVGGELEATGLTERGSITVSQISMGYTEDQLQGLIVEVRDPRFPDSLRPGVSFFYEVQEDRQGGHRIPGTAAFSQFPPSDLRSPRRRFQLQGTPTRDVGGFQWSIQLVRSDGERGRSGEVRAVEGANGNGG